MTNKSINASEVQEQDIEIVYAMEPLAEAVHQGYCSYYAVNHGQEYWTKGDYTLLDEETKQIDRETVKAVLSAIPRLKFIEVADA